MVDYLNNHNGGFFRFFNQQLQQQPQYQQYAQQYADQFTGQKPSSPSSDSNEDRYSPRDPQTDGANSRILNDPIDIDYVGSKVTSFPTRQQRPQKVIFQSDERVPDDQPQESNGNGHNSVYTTRGGKRLTFPSRSEKLSSAMIFPDRTGTGNLILSSDVSGHYKIIFANEEYGNRKSRKIKFQPDLQKSQTKMKFPDEE